MNERIARLRKASLEAFPTVHPERAILVTEYYKTHDGMYSVPVMRAKNFYNLCEKKTLYLGDEELIVGERGPQPKVVPTFPELTCHTLEDLRTLHTRDKTSYAVDGECLRVYEEQIIPYWEKRSMRAKLFDAVSEPWLDAYKAGVFTEFMEQRAPGHTVLDGKIYRRGLLDFKREIVETIEKLDLINDTDAYAKREQLVAMDISCDAAIIFAERHAKLAEQKAAAETNPERKKELQKIADVCRWVPAHAPRDFHEALQTYWFCHLAIITELNGWDSMSPGHLDQHLLPFYQKGLKDGTLTKEQAKELLDCFFIKFNNHPAPSKVGVTAAESGTYTDFANINLAGMLPDGSDGSNDLTHLILDVIDEMHLLQPSNNVQVSRKTPDAVLHHALRVIRKGYGFPSLFNSDAAVEEQIRMGKTLEDAREGGCSGCVEVGAFGKEAYILNGYFNLVKVLEITLNNGYDPRTKKQLGPQTGEPESLKTMNDLLDAFRKQLHYFIDVKMEVNQLVEQMYARLMPAPFLSVVINDCIQKAKDYNAGGARYNNSYLQFVGIGTLTDCLSSISQWVYDESVVGLKDFVRVLNDNFEGEEMLRQRCINRSHRYGNDDDYADAFMCKIFQVCFDAVDGRPNTKGGHHRILMLPTTCHVYFGSVTGATPDGRKAKLPLSEGISPVQGADRRGPTAVIKSAAKMDHIKSGGTLLNMKFTPSLLADENGIEKLAHLVRAYFKMDGHHIQFNVVRADTLREAQKNPEAFRDLIVRVAGYSDYFCDLLTSLQDEIIARTEHEMLQ